MLVVESQQDEFYSRRTILNNKPCTRAIASATNNKNNMKRFFFLTYGIIAYIISVGSIAYIVGFVSGLIVPKHIDSERGSALGWTLLIDGALISLFALQHSIMARPAFKRRWTKIIPEPIERSTYTLCSSLCLLLLFWLWQPLGGIVWQVESETLRIVLLSLCLLGFAIVLISTFLINHFDLFGLRQVWLYFAGKKYEHLPFRTPLFYKHVRHPLYLGFIIAFWATPTMTAIHFFFATIMTCYILIAIKFEEDDLMKHLGAKYENYKRSTPMLIPFTKSLRK
jgi:methanethiol S-methyltransferase